MKCHHPQHDHDVPPCPDCGQPVHWNTAIQDYVHNEPRPSCWLYRDHPSATPCLTPVPPRLVTR
jgi:hypothetical protein